MIKILQLTDMHLFADRQTNFIGINTYTQFAEVIAAAASNTAYQDLDLLIISGDLSHDYSSQAYDLVMEGCKNFSCAIAAIPGNHDSFSLFNHALRAHRLDTENKSIIYENWHIVLLNSSWEGHVAGILAPDELKFLAKTLEKHPEKRTIIFVHHHILPVGSNWLDKVGLGNPADFFAIVDRHPQISAVVCGHVHQDTAFTRNGVNYLSTPACGWQFSPNSHNFKLDQLMPGYRCLCLNGNECETTVFRLPYNAAFVPDINSVGY